MKIGFALATALFLAVAGCATRPIATSEATETTRILPGGQQYRTESPDTTVVVVKRDSGLVGAGCTTRVHVDAVPVADIRVSEKVTLHLPVGEHIISVQSCGAGLTEAVAQVEAGRPMAFRVAADMSGGSGIYRTAF